MSEYGWAIGAAQVATSAAIAAKNAKLTREENRKNREFQERMSNTAVRRQVRDMRRAGINPILAAGYSGASTPPGSSMNPQIGEVDIAGALSTAEDAATKKTTQDLNKAAEKTHGAQQLLLGAQTAAAEATRAKTETENKILEYQLPGAKLEAEFDQSPAGQITRALGRISPLLAGGLGAALGGAMRGQGTDKHQVGDQFQFDKREKQHRARTRRR